MPRYTFECKTCQKEETLWLSFDEISVYSHYCSKCGENASRVFNSPGMIYKGPGFRTTDARDHGSGERIKEKAKKIKELWKSNTKLRKKIKKYGNY